MRTEQSKNPSKNANDQHRLQNLLKSYSNSLLDSTEDEQNRKPSNYTALDLESYAVYFWIDAICINQSDITERSNQVRKMKQIYAAASQTFVWLGDHSQVPENEAKNAFDFITELMWKVDPTSTESNAEHSTNQLLAQRTSIEKEHKEAVESLTGSQIGRRSAAILAISKLLRLPWFRRAWIVQEFTHSKGPKYRSVNELENTNDSPVQLLLLRKWHLRSVKNGPAARKLSEDIFASKWLELLRLTARHFKATDPRDTVYAFLGLVPCDELPQEIRPDYSLPEAQVFHQCSVFLLRHACGSLDTLLGAARSPANVPSWVPNWTSFHGLADEDTHSVESNDFEVSKDGNSLIVQGVLVGKITTVLKRSMPRGDEFDHNAKLKDHVPLFGAALRALEEDCSRALLLSNPKLTASEIWEKWATMWELHGDIKRFYDILTGRKEPEDHETGHTLISCDLIQRVAIMSVSGNAGIACLDSGDMAMLNSLGSSSINDLMYGIRGVSALCLLRYEVDNRRFILVGRCYRSSYLHDLGSEWFENKHAQEIALC
ncbi:Heterokaryon incompatibility protein [Paramyrothecium foliicola]|nr:Heterokaryon incompatibility protein [Paramyrothecium foliicola]